MLITMRVVLQTSRHLCRRQTPQSKLHHAERENGLVPRSAQQDKAKASRFQQTRNSWLELLVATHSTFETWLPGLRHFHSFIKRLFTCKISVSRRRLSVTSFTCIREALIFTALAHALQPCVVFCMRFQPNRSTSTVRKGRNIVMPLCKVRADFPHNSHLLHRMSP
jgi:hypothetical protein